MNDLNDQPAHKPESASIEPTLELGQAKLAPVYKPNPPIVSFPATEINLDGTVEGQVLSTAFLSIHATYPLIGEWQMLVAVNSLNSGKFDPAVKGPFWMMKDPAHTWFKLRITLLGLPTSSPGAYGLTYVSDTSQSKEHSVKVELIRGPGAGGIAQSPNLLESQLYYMVERLPYLDGRLVTALLFLIPTPKFTVPPRAPAFTCDGVDGALDGIKWESPVGESTYIFAVKPSEYGDVYLSGPTSAALKKIKFGASKPAPGDEVLLRITSGDKNYDSELIKVPGGDSGGGIKPTGVIISGSATAVSWEAPNAGDVYLYAAQNSVPIGRPTVAAEGMMSFDTPLTPGRFLTLKAVRGHEEAMSDRIAVPYPDYNGDPGGKRPEAGGDEDLRPQNIVVSRPSSGKLILQWSSPHHQGGGNSSTRGWGLGVDTGVMYGTTHHSRPGEITCTGQPGTRVRVIMERVKKPEKNRYGWSQLYTL